MKAWKKFKILLKLWNPSYKGRSLSTLRKAAGLNGPETRDLLKEMNVKEYTCKTGKTRYKL